MVEEENCVENCKNLLAKYPKIQWTDFDETFRNPRTQDKIKKQKILLIPLEARKITVQNCIILHSNSSDKTGVAQIWCQTGIVGWLRAWQVVCQDWQWWPRFYNGIQRSAQLGWVLCGPNMSIPQMAQLRFMWPKSVNVTTVPVGIWFILTKSANSTTGPGVVWFMLFKSVNATTGLIMVWLMCPKFCHAKIDLVVVWFMSCWATSGLSFFVIFGPSVIVLSRPVVGQTSFVMLECSSRTD